MSILHEREQMKVFLRLGFVEIMVLRIDNIVAITRQHGKHGRLHPAAHKEASFLWKVWIICPLSPSVGPSVLQLD